MHYFLLQSCLNRNTKCTQTHTGASVSRPPSKQYILQNACICVCVCVCVLSRNLPIFHNVGSHIHTGSFITTTTTSIECECVFIFASHTSIAHPKCVSFFLFRFAPSTPLFHPPTFLLELSLSLSFSTLPNVAYILIIAMLCSMRSKSVSMGSKFSHANRKNVASKVVD